MVNFWTLFYFWTSMATLYIITVIPKLIFTVLILLVRKWAGLFIYLSKYLFVCYLFTSNRIWMKLGIREDYLEYLDCVPRRKPLAEASYKYLLHVPNLDVLSRCKNPYEAKGEIASIIVSQQQTIAQQKPLQSHNIHLNSRQLSSLCDQPLTKIVSPTSLMALHLSICGDFTGRFLWKVFNN